MARSDTTASVETTRRGVLRAVGIGAVSVGATAASASVTSAQVTTTAAISDDAPSFSDENDYTGLFVHVRSVSNDQTVDRLGSCPFFGGDDEAIVYIARLIDRTAENHPSEETLLYAVEGNDDIDIGNLYVVNSQESCDGPLVQLSLESVGGSPITVSNETTETAADDEPAAETTETTTPGFGPLAGAVGFGGAALLLRRLSGRDE
ncbi:hypothetical protein [Haloprofundus salilacus]|uniref:hypothetical protein n=1 Tax=Haloprofundus salilacus TaxID=2876190 RepID=UPI001CCD9258|nr:hypothetical protein [Haloprofundus salilacus]